MPKFGKTEIMFLKIRRIFRETTVIAQTTEFRNLTYQGKAMDINTIFVSS